MFVYERDQYTEAHRRGPGWRFFLLWLLAGVLGAGIGQGIAASLERALTPPEDEYSFLALVVAGLVSGVLLGMAQSFVLFPYLKLAGAGQWFLATTVGRALRWMATPIIGAILTTPYYDAGLPGPSRYLVLVVFALAASATGVAVGFPQYWVLRGRVQHPGWWFWTSAGVSSVGWLFVYLAALLLTNGSRPWLLDESPQMDPATFAFLAAIMTYAMSGIVLNDLLKHPTDKAEWQLSWRREKPPSISIEPQLSPEAQASLISITGETHNKSQS